MRRISISLFVLQLFLLAGGVFICRGTVSSADSNHHMLAIYEYTLQSQPHELDQETLGCITRLLQDWPQYRTTLSAEQEEILDPIVLHIKAWVAPLVRAQREMESVGGQQLVGAIAQERLRDEYLRTLVVNNLIVTNSIVLPPPFNVDNFVKRSGDTMYGSLTMLDGQEILFSTTSNLLQVGIGASPDLQESYTLLWPLTGGLADQLLSTDGNGQLLWTSALESLNGQTGVIQTFTTGSTGIVPTIVSNDNLHTFNIPNANVSGVVEGLLSNTQIVAYNTVSEVLQAATPFATPDTLVLRDNAASFSAQDITAEGNFNLLTTTSISGQLRIDDIPVLQTFGTQNTFVGAYAGSSFDAGIGTANTAVGDSAQRLLAGGNGNTAVGSGCMSQTTGCLDNTALGCDALQINEAIGNTAIGFSTLKVNTGAFNTAVGYQALAVQVADTSNTAIGGNALSHSTSGGTNTAVGSQSLINLQTGFNNIALGYNAGSQYTTSESNNLTIGTTGSTADNNVIRIGSAGTHTSCFIMGINGVTSAGGAAVYVNALGQLGTVPSAQRFKTNIESLSSQASTVINSLRPVSFNYRDAHGNPLPETSYGLIAEEVQQVSPDLVVTDQAGQPLTIKYHYLDALYIRMLQDISKELTEVKAELALLKARR